MYTSPMPLLPPFSSSPFFFWFVNSHWLYSGYMRLCFFFSFTLLYQMVNIISSSDYWINFKAYRKIIIIKSKYRAFNEEKDDNDYIIENIQFK